MSTNIRGRKLNSGIFSIKVVAVTDLYYQLSSPFFSVSPLPMMLILASQNFFDSIAPL